MHLTKKHKLTIITHRDQKIFNVTVINFRNLSTYVQKQIDEILCSNENAKVYIDDIVIFFKILKKHLTHLKKTFDILRTNNILIKLIKLFIEYCLMLFFEQHVNSFKFVIDEQKLKMFFSLIFSNFLKQFEIYLKLTN